MTTALSAIHIFPLKSGAALSLREAQVQTRGLAHDRRWMVIDATGKFVTGRQLSRLTLIRALADTDGVTLGAPGMPMLRVQAPVSGTRVATAVWGAAVAPRLADAAAPAWLSTDLGPPHRRVHQVTERRSRTADTSRPVPVTSRRHLPFRACHQPLTPGPVILFPQLTTHMPCTYAFK